MSNDGPGTPTDEDRELFERIKDLIRNHSEAFVETGQQLDERYSHTGTIRWQAKEKRQKHHRSKGVKNAMPLTRAQGRKDNFPPPEDSDPLQRDDGGLMHPPEEGGHRHSQPGRFADGQRKPMLTFTRFLRAIEDVKSGEPLDEMVEHDRRATARRILLLTWLITDPDADQFEPVLTHEFQLCGWKTRDGEGKRKADKLSMLLPPEWEDDERGYVEHFQDRYSWRVTVFGFDPPWIEWVRQAWSEVLKGFGPPSEHNSFDAPTTESAEDAPVNGGLTGEDRVLALFIKHPEWTDTQLAHKAGVHRSSLYRMTKFVQAKAVLKQQARGNYRQRQNARQGAPDDSDDSDN